MSRTTRVGRADPGTPTLCATTERRRQCVLLKMAVLPVLELGSPVAKAAALSNEHIFGRGVTIELPLPPRDGELPGAIGLLHEHEVPRRAATGFQNLMEPHPSPRLGRGVRG